VVQEERQWPGDHVSKVSSSNVLEGLDAGADDYMTKPLAVRELTARILALLRRAMHPQEVLATGRYTLYPSTLTVMQNGEAIILSPGEFALLELLVRHPNETFSSNVLMERLWPGNQEVSTDALRGLSRIE
jgi:DNA-binding response OmpR family regulator